MRELLKMEEAPKVGETGATEGARRATGVAPGQNSSPHVSSAEPTRPDPEVGAKTVRRRFSAEYKRRVLDEADRCTQPGELGALLRREGLYSSHLSNWRRRRERGELKGLSPKKRGRKAKPHSPLTSQVAKLERENERLRHNLRQAETIIEVQKKVSELLGIPLRSPDDEGQS